MDRRAFLRLAAAGAGAAVLDACTRRAPKGEPAIVPSSFEHLRPDVARRARFGLQVFPGGLEYLANDPAQRLTLGLADKAGATIAGVTARLWVGAGRAPARGPFQAAYERYARAQPGDPQGFNVVTVPMPATGIVDLMVEAAGLYGFTTIFAREKPRLPAAGAHAIPFATPTVGHPRGVKHVCTRKPPCPMHAIRLDEALRAGKPVVFTIASPLLCTSRTCGPVVDEIVRVRATRKARAGFVHAEVYRGDSATDLSPTATAWNIESEPWTFVIDGKGVVRARFEGPVAAREIAAALDPLL